MHEEGEDIQNDVSKIHSQFQELKDHMVTKYQFIYSQNMTKMELKTTMTISLREKKKDKLEAIIDRKNDAMDIKMEDLITLKKMEDLMDRKIDEIK